MVKKSSLKISNHLHNSKISLQDAISETFWKWVNILRSLLDFVNFTKLCATILLKNYYDRVYLWTSHNKKTSTDEAKEIISVILSIFFSLFWKYWLFNVLTSRLLKNLFENPFSCSQKSGLAVSRAGGEFVLRSVGSRLTSWPLVDNPVWRLLGLWQVVSSSFLA